MAVRCRGVGGKLRKPPRPASSSSKQRSNAGSTSLTSKIGRNLFARRSTTSKLSWSRVSPTPKMGEVIPGSAGNGARGNLGLKPLGRVCARDGEYRDLIKSPGSK